LTKHVLHVASVVVLIFVHYLYPQEKAISAEAQNLVRAIGDLKKDPSNLAVQQRYLSCFPRNYAVFLHLFEPGQELYDGSEYIDALSRLATNHENTVGQILVQLSKDAKYAPDAPSYLQQATTKYASQHAQIFASIVRHLSIEERAHVITFLADVENYSAYPEYQETIHELDKLGEKRLVEQFQIARRERQSKPHD